jgi:signal transduction histidine kinase
MKRRFWRGSTLQSITVIIIPLTVLLVVISLGSFQVHQNAMRSLVGTRDERSVLTAASALESEISHREYAIRTLAALAGSSSQASLESVLDNSQDLMEQFDYGTAFFNSKGDLIAAGGNSQCWQYIQTTPELASILHLSSGSAPSKAFVYPAGGFEIVLVSAPVTRDGEVAVGAFSPDQMIQSTLEGIYPPGGQIGVYIIDSSFQILFHSGPRTLEGITADHPGIQEAFQGKNGTTYVKVANDEHVVAYSLIHSVDWAIITEESWETVSSPTLSTTQIIPLVMVPALLLALLAMWFGARQIVKPLQKLEAKAARLSWGDFKPIEEPVGGIAEIRDLQNELAHMAAQVRAAEQSLHSYIGAITQGQEAERLRLARELHDDTIQALIALKQRIQLAQMALKKNGGSAELKELETLAEASIDDLRRTTRALRPIYLEDLGLVPALEMLVGENGQQIELRSNGQERRLPAETELALYRMVQEALNNAVHHANAKYISVSLDFSVNQLTVMVQDDGKGFEVPRTPADFTPQGHFGLLGLYERAELIGAHLDIISSPGNGTQLTITLPYLQFVKSET